jgi:YggT family protein
MFALYQILELLLRIATYVIVIQAVLSWLIAFNIINTYNDFVRSVWEALQKMTEPMYRPIRKILPDFGALDISPIIVLLILHILRTILLPQMFTALS